MMRITFLLPTVGFSGGIRVVAIYAQWLAEQGHQVLLISQAMRPLPFKKKIKRWLTGLGRYTYVAQPPSHFDGLPLEHRLLPYWQRPNAENTPPSDVLVSTWWETAEWAAQLPADRGARVYFVQHHEVFDFVPRERCEATYRLPFHKIVIAQWLADVMRDNYGDPQCDLVSNAVDHSLFFAPARGKQPSPTVGFLYHEANFKGMDIALQVVDKLYKIYPDLRVLAFGSSPPGGVYTLNPRIELYTNPAQATIRELYAQCDVWLSTSRTEGFNLMAMEAMACRTPLVSTRTGWPVEGVQDGYNGYLIDVDDIAGAVAAVRRVIDAPEDAWRALSNSAHGTVEDSTWDNSCRMFEQALHHAVVRAKRGEISGVVVAAANSGANIAENSGL